MKSSMWDNLQHYYCEPCRDVTVWVLKEGKQMYGCKECGAKKRITTNLTEAHLGMTMTQEQRLRSASHRARARRGK